MKSHARALTELAECIYKDASAKCAADPQKRDLMTIRSRVESEGVSFLTITLPKLGQDFEKGLDTGLLDPDLFRSFKKRLKAPAFLQGFFGLVFDVRTGRILDEPSVEAIESIRQIAYAFKKLRLPCTQNRVRSALQEFVECEHIFSKPMLQDDIDDFRQVSHGIWNDILGASDLQNPWELVPKHGPGATAEKVSGNQKFKFSRWHERLEQYFPLFHFALPSESAYESKEFESITLISEEEEQPVRVIPVPKTLKTPRIIAIEPVCMQYAQQAISRSLVKVIESHPLTSGHIGFTDQSVNQRLAMKSSKDKSLATLDLSSASDRVPLSLVEVMLESNPYLCGAILACRSKRAELPDGDIITLRKFASMGSALCFPIEAMYFYTICVMALIKRHNLPVTSHNIRRMARDVYVYGDDIIVPANAAAVVCDYLQKYYCKVNVHKSFWNGNFRESCGTDAYNGETVTPVYVRELHPADKRDAQRHISYVKSSNLFYQKGYWLTSQHMMNIVETQLGELPLVEETCPGLGKVTYQNLSKYRNRKIRINRRYQCEEVLTFILSPVYRSDKIDGYNALLKCLLSNIQPDEVVDARHLSRSVRRGAVTLKRRWVRPY